jgi:hypothetical protein
MGNHGQAIIFPMVCCGSGSSPNCCQVLEIFMNPFDTSIIIFLNSFARHSWAFDSFVYMLSGNDLLKGGVVVALI